MTTPLFLLRCCEVGIPEKSNDGVKYARIAGQEEFDKF